MQVAFGADKNFNRFRTLFMNFTKPFVQGIIERVLVNHRKADEKYISFLIRDQPKLLVLLLSCCIPQPQLHLIVPHFNISNIVIEHSRHIVCGEIICGVADQHRCFPSIPIANQYQLNWYRSVFFYLI